jgi:uncharacterized protein (TIGR03435 family)
MFRRVFLILLACCGAYGQTVQFDVESVKPSEPTGRGGGAPRPSGCNGGPGTTDPGRWVCNNVSLSTLISTAYKLRRYQFTPQSWMYNTNFDIVAKIPAGSTAEQLRLMVQSLLATRFKLTEHFEDKEMTGYELTVGKNGAKLKTSVDDPPDYTPSPAPKTMNWDEEGYPILPPGNETVLWFVNGRVSNRWRKITVDVLADYCADELQGPVTDSTHLTGTYDVTLKFMQVAMPKPGTPIQTGPNGERIAPMVEPGADLKSAVQSQWGLKLEPKRGIGKAMVIDHVEKIPVEN